MLTADTRPGNLQAPLGHSLVWRATFSVAGGLHKAGLGEVGWGGVGKAQSLATRCVRVVAGPRRRQSQPRAVLHTDVAQGRGASRALVLLLEEKVNPDVKVNENHQTQSLKPAQYWVLRGAGCIAATGCKRLAGTCDCRARWCVEQTGSRRHDHDPRWTRYKLTTQLQKYASCLRHRRRRRRRGAS